MSSEVISLKFAWAYLSLDPYSRMRYGQILRPSLCELAEWPGCAAVWLFPLAEWPGCTAVWLSPLAEWPGCTAVWLSPLAEWPG